MDSWELGINSTAQSPPESKTWTHVMETMWWRWQVENTILLQELRKDLFIAGVEMMRGRLGVGTHMVNIEKKKQKRTD